MAEFTKVNGGIIKCMAKEFSIGQMVVLVIIILGRKYDGMYGNDKRNGFGTYYWASG